MPVTYVIDKSRGLIHTRCVGETTFAEVLHHFEELEEDPECRDHLDVLLDLRDLIATPTADQLRGVSATIQEIKPIVRFGACAVVASRDAVFGLGRMFEAVAGEAFKEMRVFRSLDDAEAWLRSRSRSS